MSGGGGDDRAWSSWGAEQVDVDPALVRRTADLSRRRRWLLRLGLPLLGLGAAAAVVAMLTRPTPAPASAGTGTDYVKHDGVRLAAPPPEPEGDGPYRFIATQGDGTGDPVAYDPCFPIPYVVRPDGAPAEGPRLLAEAMAEISRATGLVFEDKGSTDEAPTPERDAYRLYSSVSQPVLIAWSDATESPTLAGDVEGYGGSAYVEGNAWSTRPAPGSRRYVSGQVVLDAPDIEALLLEPKGRTMARAVVEHELAHLVGLAHVTSETQLMNPAPTVTALQAGDLQGLARLGRGLCYVG